MQLQRKNKALDFETQMNQMQLFTALAQMLHVFPDIVDWSDDGLSFAVINFELFINQVLPAIFNHSNFIKFWRLLIQEHHFNQHRDCEGKLTLEFSHPDFQRPEPEQLESIELNVSNIY